MSETVKDITAEVERSVAESEALFKQVQELLVTYVTEKRPAQTAIILALLDLLSVWAQAVRAPRADIIHALNMCWDNLLNHKPTPQINSIREMDKHVN